MNGLLLIDKPKNWTSFDVVAKIRGILRAQRVNRPKVGHTGTLDPLATGLLVVCVGSYCKRASEYSKLDKTYQVEMELGTTSTTDDDEGEKTPTNKPVPSKKAVETAILSFTGEIKQIPPAFSAIKVEGKQAYKLARAGKEVKIEPRKVTIYEIKNISIQMYKDTPCTIEDCKARPCRVSFTAKVSSGTYIRSLVRDIGEKLGCGAYMTNLRRTQVGDFKLPSAHKIDALKPDNLQSLILE